MEVASGEYGEAIHDLALANENENGFQMQNIANVSKAISNDICKSISISPTKLSTVAKQSSADEISILKLTKCDTVFNIANNNEQSRDAGVGIDDDTTSKTTPHTTCTTSLLESNKNVITLPNKGAFPTSGIRQFWILLKRAFLTIIRDKQLTQMRLVSHIVVGSIIGMIYYDIGNDA